MRFESALIKVVQIVTSTIGVLVIVARCRGKDFLLLDFILAISAGILLSLLILFTYDNEKNE